MRILSNIRAGNNWFSEVVRLHLRKKLRIVDQTNNCVKDTNKDS